MLIELLKKFHHLSLVRSRSIKYSRLRAFPFSQTKCVCMCIEKPLETFEFHTQREGTQCWDD